MGNFIRPAQAGTLESNDIIVMVGPGEQGGGIVIELESIVAAQYGAQIRRVIADTAKKLGVADVFIKAIDRGALDCTIEARTEAALRRACTAAKEGGR